MYQSGFALTSILYGEVTPSGRVRTILDHVPSRSDPPQLPYTIAKNVTDYAQPFQIATPRKRPLFSYPRRIADVARTEDYPQINYTEGVLIDYRGLQVRNISTRYPFGLSLPPRSPIHLVD